MKVLKQQDVRVGNLVFETLEGVPACQIKLDAEQICLIEESDMVYVGIPITEGRLTDLGFQDNNSYFSLIDFPEFKVSWSIRIVSTGERRHFYLDDNFPESFQIRLEYIHEIQNLFHSLTGEELKPQEK
jgi:hypothetical protein